MDMVIQKKTSPLNCKFNRDQKFTLSVKPLFSDHSMNKFEKSTVKVQELDEKVKSLEESRVGLSYSISKHKLLNEKVKSFTEEYFEFVRVTNQAQEMTEKMEIAARKIQEMFRRRKMKKWVDERVVGKVRPRLKKQLGELREQAQFCFWNVGKNANLFAVKIQRWVRRLKFVQKIKRLEKVYNIYKSIRKNNSTLLLKKALSWFISKEKMTDLIFQKFKQSKLIKIKRTLAILKIKSIIKQEKINLKLMKQKIRKYRRNTYMQEMNRKRTRKYSNLSEVSELKKRPTDIQPIEEDSESQVSESKEKVNKFELFRLNEIRKEKISMGLISHSIKPKTYKIFRTFRQGILPQTNKQDLPTISMKIPLTLKELSQNSQSVSPVRTNKWKKIKPNVTKPTKSFLHYKSKEEQVDSRPELPRNFRFRFRGKILLPTLSKKEKIRSKSQIKDEPKWNKSGKVSYDEVESLYVSESKINPKYLYARTPSPDRIHLIKHKILGKDHKLYFPNTWNEALERQDYVD